MIKFSQDNSSRAMLELLLVFSIFNIGIFSAFPVFAATGGIPPYRGSAAMADTRRAVAFGERPSGSQANLKLREWIISQLKPLGGQLTVDSFTAQTPTGPVPMANIVLRFAGTSGRAIAVTGHFDTKKIPMVHFLGANDGGSSTGFLIEFARVAARMPHRDDLYVVFFDGEEAIGEWTDRDSIYGSKHLAAKWASDGTLGHLRALINVDMIGDKDLDIMNDGNSTAGLVQQMQAVADKIGDGKYFLREKQGIEDDHLPFAESGVNVLDIIDFTYGPNNAYWHTAQDTGDKLSEHSFQVVGDVVVGVVRALER
jgi:Zn-dependent M28 family amino/carboxypeptidase